MKVESRIKDVYEIGIGHFFRRCRPSVIVAVLLVCLPARAEVSTQIEAGAIIKAMETLLWSQTSHSRVVMTIETPHWQRSLELDVWMDRPESTFVRVLSPRKERGISSLRSRSEMWNYIPRIDRVVKVPPSMMLQPWMGSDLSNDDLVKESSLFSDYTHDIADVEEQVVRIVSVPREDAAVVWGRVESWIEQNTSVPRKQSYFDDAGSLVREMVFRDVRNLGGRSIPTRWEVRPVDEPGHRTIMEIKTIEFDLMIKTSTFTERNLRSLDW